MSAKSESIVKSLLESIKSPSKETQPYDTSATVTRVEDDTVFVHIPGGVAETPVSKTISCKVGDTVQVRVGGGKAWLVGNASAPPTDDTTANTAIMRTNQLGDSLTKLQKIAGNTDQYFWHVETGEDTGSHITEIPKERFLEAPALGGGNLLLRSNGIAIRDGLNELATFSSSAIQFNQPGTSTVVATIGTSGLYIQKGVIKLGNKTSASDTTNSGTYIDANGNMSTSNILATGGTIGGFSIGSTQLSVYGTASGVGTSSNGLYWALMNGSPGANGGNVAFGVASRTSTSASWTWNTYMTYSGYFYSKNANIQGTINASAGKIGGWDLSASTLSSTTYGVGSIRSAYAETAVFIENGEVKFKNSYSASSNTYLLNSEGVWGYFYVNDRLYCNDTFVADGQLHLGTAYDSDVHISCVWSDNLWHDIITRNGSSNDVYIGGSKDIANITTRTMIRGDSVKLQYTSGDTITSDRNIKKDITAYDSKYDDFYDALNPITYKFIHGKSGRKHSGFISQEVRDALLASGLSTDDFGGYVLDEITHRETDTDGSDLESSDINYLLDHDITELHQLIYHEFISLNTWQIQKLKARVDELEARLNG